jgi:hypothetical protein
MRSRFTATLFVIGATASIAGAAPQPGGSAPALLVRFYDFARLSPEVRLRAQTEASRAYQRIGVELTWLGVDDAIDENESRLVLSIVILPRPVGDSPHAPERTMGVTPRRPTADPRIAFVFYDRLHEVAHLAGDTGARVLGNILAHEIGHLLLPSDAHSIDGIMRAEWDDRQLQLATTSILDFTQEQAQRIRDRLSVEPAAADAADNVGD